jgi:hypothetical protein
MSGGDWTDNDDTQTGAGEKTDLVKHLGHDALAVRLVPDDHVLVARPTGLVLRVPKKTHTYTQNKTKQKTNTVHPTRGE